MCCRVIIVLVCLGKVVALRQKLPGVWAAAGRVVSVRSPWVPFLHCPVHWLFDLLCLFLTIWLSRFSIATPALLYAALSMSKSLDLLDKCTSTFTSPEVIEWNTTEKGRFDAWGWPYFCENHRHRHPMCHSSRLWGKTLSRSRWMKHLLEHFSDTEFRCCPVCVNVYRSTGQQIHIQCDWMSCVHKHLLLD